MLYLVAKFACRIAIFPGSFYLYRRRVESHRSMYFIFDFRILCRYVLIQVLNFRNSFTSFCDVAFDLDQLSEVLQSNLFGLLKV